MTDLQQNSFPTQSPILTELIKEKAEEMCELLQDSIAEYKSEKIKTIMEITIIDLQKIIKVLN